MDIFTVYKITCTINNKLYIGYTKNTLQNRLKGHFKKAFSGKYTNVKFFNAIKKYGKISFIIEPIKEFDNKLDATTYEIEMIKFYHTYTNGYNSTLGGDGGNTSTKPMTDEHKNKISNALKNRVLSNEHRENIKLNHHDVSGNKNPMYGKTSSGSFKSGLEHPKSQSIIIDGVLYESLNIASKTLNLHRTTIKKRYLNDE